MYGGSVISSTIAQRAYATLAPADSLVIQSGEVTEVVHSEEDLELKGDYLDVCRAVLRYYWDRLPNRQFALRCRTDIPFQSGLAGSTALVISLVGCLKRFIGEPLTFHLIAEEVHQIELEIMGVTCGFQDQYIEVFGSIAYMDFRGKESLKVGPQYPLATVEYLHAYLNFPIPFILATTGIERSSDTVHRPLRQRWEEGEVAVIQGYERIAELARLGKRALLARDWSTLGRLMNENHEIQKSLGGSHPACDALIESALSAGAFGAKLAGAGKGGTIIALHPEPRSLEPALREAGAFRIIYPQPTDGLTVTGRF